MTVKELEETILETARELYAKGPGFAQQAVVIREVAKRVDPRTIEEEQAILSTWHQLFRTGRLAWGFNLDSPGPPWFHFPTSDTSQ